MKLLTCNKNKIYFFILRTEKWKKLKNSIKDGTKPNVIERKEQRGSGSYSESRTGHRFYVAASSKTLLRSKRSSSVLEMVQISEAYDKNWSNNSLVKPNFGAPCLIILFCCAYLDHKSIYLPTSSSFLLRGGTASFDVTRNPK